MGAATPDQPVTNQIAVSITGFWRALNILTGVVASLPFDVYRVTQDSAKRQYRHPLAKILRRSPNEINSKFDFFQTLVLHLLTSGNAYAKIVRNPATGLATRLYLIAPDRVRLTQNARNQYIYIVTGEDGSETRHAADKILHVSGLSWDAVTGINLVDTFKTVFGTALYNQDFLANFYKNGAAVSGVVTVPQSLTDDAYKRLSSSWQSRYGGAGNVGKTAILEQGATYNRTGLSPAEAGVGDAKKVTTADIARITGVPQFLLEDLDRATFNNIEHLGLLFVTYTILPLCQNIEAELSRKLLPEADQMNYEIRSDLHSLLRADTENRAKLIESMMKWGIINRDEARAIEGLNPIADGSGQAYYVPMNMIDPTKPMPEPAEPEPAQNDNEDDTDEQAA